LLSPDKIIWIDFDRASDGENGWRRRNSSRIDLFVKTIAMEKGNNLTLSVKVISSSEFGRNGKIE
jgi:hypothetical protein